ncbi:predicted protein [Uncinocarpus reesii 1704]|uniref:Uncharacterized protein n=1 Tax=Uncinocarpus reesii (strain UAMH 1704) TaxID=336963 RepID=C4JVL3_UNCRE|nr:uncharacterized protein UREG_06605 [Uncinocarpus reesii 1704]EEP81740.1 predicted protein [Uncinocarpus reesii 1704]
MVPANLEFSGKLACEASFTTLAPLQKASVQICPDDLIPANQEALKYHSAARCGIDPVFESTSLPVIELKGKRLSDLDDDDRCERGRRGHSLPPVLSALPHALHYATMRNCPMARTRFVPISIIHRVLVKSDHRNLRGSEQHRSSGRAFKSTTTTTKLPIQASNSDQFLLISPPAPPGPSIQVTNFGAPGGEKGGDDHIINSYLAVRCRRTEDARLSAEIPAPSLNHNSLIGLLDHQSSRAVPASSRVGTPGKLRTQTLVVKVWNPQTLALGSRTSRPDSAVQARSWGIA